MDAATPSKRARTTATAAASPADTPQKTLVSADGVATPEKPTRKVPADQVWTPAKTERRPLLRRAAGKGAVALSVKEVRRAALELRRTGKGRAEVAAEEEEDALESVARQLGVGGGAGRSPVKRRPEVKLPQRKDYDHCMFRLRRCWAWPRARLLPLCFDYFFLQLRPRCHATTFFDSMGFGCLRSMQQHCWKRMSLGGNLIM